MNTANSEISGYQVEDKYKHSQDFSSQGGITGHLSHQLRSPLTAIKLNIDTLMEQMNSDNRNTEAFRVINEEIKRLDVLIKDITHFTTQRETYLQDVAPDKILKQVLELLEPVLDAQRIRIIRHISEVPVKGDPGELITLFHQLIANSIEAIGEEGKIEFLSVLDIKRKMHRIFIRDTGCGIISGKRIFEPFFTTKKTGTGLGLSIVQQIIENHKGTVSLIFSEPGNTIFQVSLPLA